MAKLLRRMTAMNAGVRRAIRRTEVTAGGLQRLGLEDFV
jgi:hypothetical protein